MVSTETFNEIPTVEFCARCLDASSGIDGQLKKIWDSHFTNGGTRRGAYGYFDARVLCGIIRESEVKTVAEVGIWLGWATTFMRTDASFDRHVSFDILDRSGPVRKSLDELGIGEGWEFVVGDARETLPEYGDYLREVDLVFMDGDHREDFAEWYVHEFRLFDLIKPGAYIHIHDVLPLDKVTVGCMEGKVVQEHLLSRDDFDVMFNWEMSKSQELLERYPERIFVDHGGVKLKCPTLWVKKR